MNEPRKTRLTPEEQELKERLMRKKLGPGDIGGGSGKIPKDFLKRLKVQDPQGLLLKALLEDREEGR